MSSRNQSLQKPYWKRKSKQKPSYVKEYAYDNDGLPVMEEGHYATKLEDGTIDYDKQFQVWRQRPNRAFVRQYAAKLRKESK